MDDMSTRSPIDLTDIDAMFFDRGNVLYDCRPGPPESEKDGEAARLTAVELGEFGFDIEPHEVLESFIVPWKKSFSQRDARGHELPVEDFLAGFISGLGHTLRAEYLDAIIDSMSTAYLKWHVLEPMFTELASKLRNAGVKMGIVSNAVLPDRTYLDQLENDGIATFFDVCIYSSSAGATKPNPVLIERACERIGVLPSRCILVGDKLEKDVLCAKRAGATAVWYNVSGAIRSGPIIPEYEVSSFRDIVNRIRV